MLLIGISFGNDFKDGLKLFLIILSSREWNAIVTITPFFFMIFFAASKEIFLDLQALNYEIFLMLEMT